MLDCLATRLDDEPWLMCGYIIEMNTCISELKGKNEKQREEGDQGEGKREIMIFAEINVRPRAPTAGLG